MSVISDVGSTVGDSDDDAPLVCSQREALGVQQGMPITVGGRFTSLVEAGDECQEFDLTIADDVEESSVEVRADTDVEVAPTAVVRHNSPSASLLDALDHGLAMEDNGQVGGDVDSPADSESDIASDLGDRAAPVDPAPRNLLITEAMTEVEAGHRVDWGIFSYTPEPHVAFCPIFVHPLFPVFEPHIQKWVIFVRRRPCVCDTFRFESPPSAEKRSNLAPTPSSSLARTTTIELPECQERRGAKTI